MLHVRVRLRNNHWLQSAPDVNIFRDEVPWERYGNDPTICKYAMILRTSLVGLWSSWCCWLTIVRLAPLTHAFSIVRPSSQQQHSLGSPIHENLAIQNRFEVMWSTALQTHASAADNSADWQEDDGKRQWWIPQPNNNRLFTRTRTTARPSIKKLVRRQKSLCVSLFRKLVLSPFQRMQWRRLMRRLFVFALVLVLTTSFGYSPAADATTTSSMGMLSQTTDIPQLTLSSDSLLLSSLTSIETSGRAAMDITTTTGRNSAAITKILIGSGTLLLATRGGSLLGRLLFDTNGTRSSADNRRRSFSKPSSSSTTTSTTEPQQVTIAESIPRQKDDLFADNIKKDFRKIRSMADQEQSSIQLAQSLLSQINETVIQSSKDLAKSAKIVGKPRLRNSKANVEQQGDLEETIDSSTSNKSVPWGESPERKEQARRQVETILAQMEQAERTVVDWKPERDGLGQDLVDTQNKHGDDEVPENPPPPVEETEFVDWLQSMKRTSTMDRGTRQESVSVSSNNAVPSSLTEEEEKEEPMAVDRGDAPRIPDFYFADTDTAPQQEQAPSHGVEASSDALLDSPKDPTVEYSTAAVPSTKEETSTTTTAADSTAVSPATESTATANSDTALQSSSAKMGFLPTVDSLLPSPSSISENPSPPNDREQGLDLDGEGTDTIPLEGDEFIQSKETKITTKASEEELDVEPKTNETEEEADFDDSIQEGKSVSGEEMQPMVSAAEDSFQVSSSDISVATKETETTELEEEINRAEATDTEDVIVEPEMPAYEPTLDNSLIETEEEANQRSSSKRSFPFFQWAQRDQTVPTTDEEAGIAIERSQSFPPRRVSNGSPTLVPKSTSPSYGLRRSSSGERAAAAAKMNDRLNGRAGGEKKNDKQDFLSFANAIAYNGNGNGNNQGGNDSLQQPRSMDEEDFLKQKYGAIGDTGERAYQILLDLGMVRPSSIDEELED